jgi:hypothetical protein
MPSKNSQAPALRRPQRDRKFEIAAYRAFYGGRFEGSGLGYFSGPLNQYDKRSAHAAAMLQLPCPLHTRWAHELRARLLPKDGLYLAKISFSHPPDNLWCGLPFRHNGGLIWPYQGTGWYWSPEIEEAQHNLRADVVGHDLWVARCECDCRPFDWVSALYEERRRLGSNTRGYPLKIGLASLYGKMAQRCGHAPYHDVVSAGIITAITQAGLIRAIAQDPEAVVMLATDAVLSSRPLSLDIGEGLGQWEQNLWPDLFIVQPGVYWSPSDQEKSVKSRGAPKSIVGDAVPRFHECFADWVELMRRPGAKERVLKERLIPSVPVPMRVFIGCRLALARGKPWQAGKWENVVRHISFEWRTKRDAMRVVLGEDHLTTFPIALSILAESEGYEPADFDRLVETSGESDVADEVDENTLLEAMPDFIPFLPRE